MRLMSERPVGVCVCLCVLCVCLCVFVLCFVLLCYLCLSCPRRENEVPAIDDGKHHDC